MEISISTAFLVLLGWNVYKYFRQQRDKQNNNFIQNLIDEQSNQLLMYIRPYKKIKKNQQDQEENIPIQVQQYLECEIESQIQNFKRTALEEVKFEKFQEQFYIENSKIFDALPQQVQKKNKEKFNSKNNKDFSFSSQVKDKYEIKKNRKLSKIDEDINIVGLDSPVKEIQLLSSNKKSVQKQFTNFDDHLKNLGNENEFPKLELQQSSQLLNTQQKISFNENSIFAKLSQNKQQNEQKLSDTKQDKQQFQPAIIQSQSEKIQSQSEKIQSQPEKINLFEKFVNRQDQTSDQKKEQQCIISNNDQITNNFIQSNSNDLFQNIQMNQQSTKPQEEEQKPQLLFSFIDKPIEQNEQPLTVQNSRLFSSVIPQASQAQSQNPPQTQGLFNSNQIQSSGLFNQNQTQTTGLFNQNQTQGTGLFNQNQPQSSGLFGSNQNQTPGLISTILNNQSSNQQVPQPQVQTSVGLFGGMLNNQTEIKNDQNLPKQDQNQQQSNGLSLFGNQSTGNNMFSNQQNVQQPNNSNTQSSGGLFSFNNNTTSSGGGLFASLLNK